MGVDAVIYATRRGDVSDAELLVLAREFAEAVGPEHVYLDPSGEWHEGVPQHALARFDRDEDYEEDDVARTLGVPPESTVLEVNTLLRYYGVGYERGPLPILAAMCEWLLLRGFRVFYGGDSGGAEAMREWRAIRGDLWRHWAEKGERPYRESFGSIGRNEPWAARFCDFCDAPMTRNGWGSGFAALHCLYCGRRDETRDSGTTWKATRGDGTANAIDAEKERLAASKRAAR